MQVNKSEIIELDALHKLTRKYNADKTGELFNVKGDIGKEYAKAVAGLVRTIPKEQGFYVWGSFSRNGLWKTVYVGKAGFGKTATLNARILEELKDERAFLWRWDANCTTVETAWPELQPLVSKYFSNKESVLPERLHAHFKRALRKNKSTHIVWISRNQLSNVDVQRIEADLIETLNPTVNVQRPVPSSGLQEETINIIREFKQVIHEYRSNLSNKSS